MWHSLQKVIGFPKANFFGAADTSRNTTLTYDPAVTALHYHSFGAVFGVSTQEKFLLALHLLSRHGLSSTLTLLLAPFWSPVTPEGNI